MQHTLSLHGGYVLENYIKRGCAKLIPLGKNGTNVIKDIRYVQFISVNILALVFVGKIQMFLIRDSHGDRVKRNSRAKDQEVEGDLRLLRLTLK